MSILQPRQLRVGLSQESDDRFSIPLKKLDAIFEDDCFSSELISHGDSTCSTLRHSRSALPSEDGNRDSIPPRKKLDTKPEDFLTRVLAESQVDIDDSIKEWSEDQFQVNGLYPLWYHHDVLECFWEEIKEGALQMRDRLNSDVVSQCDSIFSDQPFSRQSSFSVPSKKLDTKLEDFLTRVLAKSQVDIDDSIKEWSEDQFQVNGLYPLWYHHDVLECFWEEIKEGALQMRDFLNSDVISLGDSTCTTPQLSRQPSEVDNRFRISSKKLDAKLDDNCFCSDMISLGDSECSTRGHSRCSTIESLCSDSPINAVNVSELNYLNGHWTKSDVHNMKAFIKSTGAPSCVAAAASWSASLIMSTEIIVMEEQNKVAMHSKFMWFQSDNVFTVDGKPNEGRDLLNHPCVFYATIENGQLRMKQHWEDKSWLYVRVYRNGDRVIQELEVRREGSPSDPKQMARITFKKK
jgi:hypothetical protein